jgi:hypothetical protein
VRIGWRRLAEAKAVLEARAQERAAAEQAKLAQSARRGVDRQEAEPTLEAIPSTIGMSKAAALDAGYFGPAMLTAYARRGIEPYIATGHDPHHPSWQQRFAPLPNPPSEDASSQVKMAYKLRTALGKAI